MKQMTMGMRASRAMSLALAAALAAAIAAATGCNRAVNTMQGGRRSNLAGDRDRLVVIGNPGLQERIALVTFAGRSVNGLMQFSIEIESRVKKPLPFEYKFVWYDKDGFEVPDSTAHWTPEIIQGIETRKRLQAIAPTPQAKDFKMMIRDPQPVTR